MIDGYLNTNGPAPETPRRVDSPAKSVISLCANGVELPEIRVYHLYASAVRASKIRAHVSAKAVRLLAQRQSMAKIVPLVPARRWNKFRSSRWTHEIVKGENWNGSMVYSRT